MQRKFISIKKLKRNNKEMKSSKKSNKTRIQFTVDVLFFKYVVKQTLKVYNLLGWCELKKI